jgi:hypothetical protein
LHGMPPAPVLEFDKPRTLDYTGCLLWRTANIQGHIAFILLFLYMAVDRVLFTIDQSRYKHRWMCKKVWNIVFALWVTSIALSCGLSKLQDSPLITESGPGCNDNNMEKSCSTRSNGEAAMRAAGIDVFMWVLPMLAVLCLYWAAQILLMKRRRQVMDIPFTTSPTVQDNAPTSTSNTGKQGPTIPPKCGHLDWSVLVERDTFLPSGMTSACPRSRIH